MFSGVAMAGIMIIFMVSIMVPITWLLICMKKVKKSNLLFIAIIGLIAMGAANNIATLVGAIKPMYELAVSGKVVNFILYLLICSAALALLEVLVRYLTINYAFKSTGGKVGLYRAMTDGIGLGAGFVMMNATDYIEMFVQAQIINAGNFIEMVTTGESALTVAEAEAYVAQLTSQPSLIYYVQAMDRVLIVLIEVTLAMMLTRFILEGRTAFGVVFTGVIRWIFEFVRMVIGYLSDDYMGGAVSVTTEMVLNIIYIVIVAFFCIMTIYVMVTRKLFPEEHMAGPSKKELEKQAQDKRAWSEMRNLSQKNLSKVDYSDAYEQAEAAQTADAEDTVANTADVAADSMDTAVDEADTEENESSPEVSGNASDQE